MISAYEPFSKKVQEALQHKDVTVAKIAKHTGLETFHVDEIAKGIAYPTIEQEHKIERAISALRGH